VRGSVRLGMGMDYRAAPATPDDPFTITSAPDGGWLLTTRPHTWYLNGRTYFCYVQGSNGDVEVRYWDRATRTASSPFVLHAALQSDTHATPTIALRSTDSRIMAVYSRQVGPAMYKRLSTNAEDISAFAAEVDLDTYITGSAYTYPMVWELGDESKWHLWYRSGNVTRRWARITSSDDGATWTSGQAIVDMTDTSYIVTQKTSESRIDIVASDGSPGTDTNVSLYHFYYDGGFFKTDGTAMGSPIFDQTDMTQVHSGTGNAGLRAIDVQRVGTDIYALFYEFNDASDARYHWAHYDGSSWTTHEIADNAKFSGIASQTGGAVLDNADPTRLYASRDVSGTMEIFKYATDDDGATFGETAITTGSSEHQHTPSVPVDRDDTLKVMWLAGSFVSASDYSVGVRGSAV
jgi:hypothetical protein